MKQKIYGISIRVQRTTVEECFVAVPVNMDLMQQPPGPNGEYGIDTDKMWAKAVELAESSGDWAVESQEVKPHPIQKAKPGTVPVTEDADRDAS
jgi:hypothetical protein